MNAAVRRAAERIVGRGFSDMLPMPRRAIPISQVCCATTRDGRRYAIKHAVHPPGVGQGGDCIATEWAALSALQDAACGVPRTVGYNREAHVFVTEWVGGPTVDDACQGEGMSQETVVDCLRRLCQIHSRCELAERGLAAHVTPRDDARLEDAFAASFARAREAFYACLHSAAPVDSATVDRCDISWSELWSSLIPHTTCLGSDDVNARNIVLSPSGPIYLDLSSLGFDWTERRAACYLTSLGMNHTPGRVVSALSPEAIEACGYGDQFALRAEGHAFVLACLAIAGMLTASSEGAFPTWQDALGSRAASARTLLARGRVADLPPTASLRREVARAFGL